MEPTPPLQPSIYSPSCTSQYSRIYHYQPASTSVAPYRGAFATNQNTFPRAHQRSALHPISNQTRESVLTNRGSSPRLPCKGRKLGWGSVFYRTFPLPVFDPSIEGTRFTLSNVGGDPNDIVVTSKRCEGWASEDGGPCKSCAGTTAYTDHLQSLAARGVGVDSYATLLQKLEDLQFTYTELNLKHLNLKKHTESTKRDLEAYEELVDFVAEHESIPAVHRVFRTSRNNGDGPNGLLKRLRAAADGTYRSRNYSEDDHDLSVLLYLLGGAAAVHAVHRSHIALPALETTRKQRSERSLKISACGLSVWDAIANISSGFRPQGPKPAPPRRVGVSLAIDEVAGNGRLCYLPRTDEIAGFCREHVSRLASILVGNNLTSICEAARALWKDEVHVGKEFTCAAISPHSMSQYGARPILLSPTCKQGTVADQVSLLSTCIQAWKRSEWGERWTGPLWSISSDGDATRRAALYALLMRRNLLEDTSLYRRLRGCVGLNLRVGEDDIVMDFDYKHVFKRLCTLFCSKKGLLVKGVEINKALLSIWLQRLTSHNWSEMSIHALLNPKDPQDVPRAVMLLSRIAELRHLDPGSNPSDQRVHQALSIIGEALDALLQPYLNVRLSLSAQLQSLAKSAHIFFALYREHKTSFVSNQLYGDLQAMIKHAIFHIAKTQDLDEDLKVSFNIFGTDVLEALFGRLRMLGGHSPNMDISVLGERCCAALNLAEIYRRHPEWESVPVRLKFSRGRDYDHVSPRNWRGDIVAKNCNIEQSWTSGAVEATCTLWRHGIYVDFAATFTAPGVDLMRPFGGNRYPGVAKDVDRSMCPDEEESQECTNLPHSTTLMTAQGEEETTGDVLPEIPMPEISDARLAPPAEINTPHSHWLRIGDRVQHKKTAVREGFNPACIGDPNEIHERVLRVRHHNSTDVWHHKLRLTCEDALPRAERFQLNDLFATLVRVRGQEVALAVALCTGIKPNSGSASIDMVPKSDLLMPTSSYHLSGQVLALKPFSTPAELLWAWKSDFIPFEAVKTRQTTSTRLPSAATSQSELVITVPCQLALPLSDEASSIDILRLPPDIAVEMGPGLSSTWLIGERAMVSLRTTLWERVRQEGSSLRAAIPTYGKILSGNFPYSTSYGSHIAGRIQAPRPKAKERTTCRICGWAMSIKDCHSHTSRHILRAICGASESCQILEPISLPYPCGFCGGPSSQGGERGTCSTRIDKGQLASSSCSRAHSFRIRTALSFKDEKPSATNAPIRCVLCNEVHWKYNMVRHLCERHPNWETLIPRDSDFRTNIYISEGEKRWMGINDDARVGHKRPSPSSLDTVTKRLRSARYEQENRAPTTT